MLYRLKYKSFAHNQLLTNLIDYFSIQLVYILVSGSPRCSQEFKFSLAAMKPTEYLLYAKLQLRATGSVSPSINYTIKIGMVFQNGSQHKTHLKKSVGFGKSRYLEIEVTDILRPLVGEKGEELIGCWQRFR